MKRSQLRIGHTMYTHGYIFTNSPRLLCGMCNTPVMVEHVLINCQKYADERKSNLLNGSIVKTLLNNSTTVTHVLHFLQQIGIYNKV